MKWIGCVKQNGLDLLMSPVLNRDVSIMDVKNPNSVLQFRTSAGEAKVQFFTNSRKLLSTATHPVLGCNKNYYGPTSCPKKFY